MRARGDSGITVVELVISVMLVGIVSVVFLPIMATSSRSIHPMQVKSQTIDSLRNSLASISREMRSAACVSEPAANAGTSNRLRFTTYANDSGYAYEVTYTAENGQLLRQVTGGDSVLVDSGLVNPGDAFTHIATPRRTVKVVFHFQPDPTEPVLDLSTVIAGRNAWHAC
ncbi:MAG: type II secretion system protein [Actinomycetota bacterium]|jgi:type II secretory pathway component PulJ